jgi:DNA repair protein RadC
MVFEREEIEDHEGIFGMEKSDWLSSREYAAALAKQERAQSSREAELLYGSGNMFGLYQVKNGEAFRPYSFSGIKELERQGLSVDSVNYDLVYAAPFSERIEFDTDRTAALNRIYADFNVNHPSDFTGRSASVSDVIVLRYNGDTSAHFVDSAGFGEISGFLAEGQHKEAVQREAERTAPGTLSQTLTPPSRLGGDPGGTKRPESVVVPAPKSKPSLLARLEENKKRVARESGGEPQKTNQREV